MLTRLVGGKAALLGSGPWDCDVSVACKIVIIDWFSPEEWLQRDKSAAWQFLPNSSHSISACITGDCDAAASHLTLHCCRIIHVSASHQIEGMLYR